MRNLLILIFVALNSSTFCQGKILLSEDFNNNKNGWILKKDSSFYVDINNGVLHVEKLRKNFDDRGCLWYKKEIKDLNTLKDFSITFIAKFLSGGEQSDIIDMQWGNWGNKIASTETSIYQLNYFLRGDVKLDHFNKGWDYSLRGKAKEIALNNLFKQGEYNKFEIIQKEGFLIFRINDIQYFKQFITPISGNSIGIQGCLKSAWQIDKLIIKQFSNKLDSIFDIKKTKDTISSIFSFNSIDSSGINIGLINVFPNPFSNEITVILKDKTSSSAKIELFDILGNLLMQYDKKLNNTEQSIRFFADVLPGNYLLRITVNNKSKSIKLLKI